jgi:hypothetical protein
MRTKASQEIKTRIIHNTQKNGDIYLAEIANEEIMIYEQ